MSLQLMVISLCIFINQLAIYFILGHVYKRRYFEECGQSNNFFPQKSVKLFGYSQSSVIFSKIFYCMFNRRKKLTQVWNNLRMSKWWYNFHFCVNYPFKHKSYKSSTCLCLTLKEVMYPGDTNIWEAVERSSESVGLISWFHVERLFVVNI